MDRGTWWVIVHGVTKKLGHDLMTIMTKNYPTLYALQVNYLSLCSTDIIQRQSCLIPREEVLQLCHGTSQTELSLKLLQVSLTHYIFILCFEAKV